MNQHSDYFEINRKSWNQRLQTHITSDFYQQDEFLKGKSSLNDIELALLGDINGKSILHLQCHFGQDTISLTKLGATVTGVDLSDEAIAYARSLASELNADTEFVCCNIYDLPKYLNKQYDIVFTSYGTITWLPNLDQWAEIIAQFLKPHGEFIFVEFHPVVWMFDDDFKNVGYHYFNREPIAETESGTYAERDANLQLSYVCWNHDFEEVISSLLKHNLSIESFKEYDYSPYNCFKHTEEFEKGKFRIAHIGNKIPMVYSIKARKKS